MITDKQIQKHIEENCRYKDGQPLMDEQAFYEGAKWMREKVSQVEPVVKPACETLQRRFDIYVKAINQIDDFFEYRYKGYTEEQIKEYVMDIIDNITKQLTIQRK